MRRLLLLTSALALAFAPAPLPKPAHDSRSDVARLQGTWEVVQYQRGKHVRTDSYTCPLILSFLECGDASPLCLSV